ncbi:hypothetical protein Hte_012400 [Hypoxylon texense]
MPLTYALIFIIQEMRAWIWGLKRVQHLLHGGTLPLRLLFETLLSLHSILFPIVDSRSKRSISLLEKCIRTQRLDKELLWFEYVRPVPSNFTFEYWGGRLEKLQELTKGPPPRNFLVSLFERHTSERNALTVAIIGLLGVFQLAITWFAWKDGR